MLDTLADHIASAGSWPSRGAFIWGAVSDAGFTHFALAETSAPSGVV